MSKIQVFFQKMLSCCLIVMLLSGFARGQQFSWAKSMGGLSKDVLKERCMAMDQHANVFVAGPLTDSIHYLSSAGPAYVVPVGKSIFITKLDSSGKHAWARSFSSLKHPTHTGSTDIIVTAIASDPEGNSIVTGTFTGSVVLGEVPDMISIAGSGGRDLYILKINPSGQVIWSINIGNQTERINPNALVACDLKGNIFCLSEFKGNSAIDFDPGPGVTPLTAISGTNTFCFLKLDPDGKLMYAKEIQSGAIHAAITNLAVEPRTGSLYAMGWSENTTYDFDPGPNNFTLMPDKGWICKLDALGNFAWAKTTGSYNPVNMKVDSEGNIVATGHISSKVDFDPGPDSVFLIPDQSAFSLGYISKLDSNGKFQWVKPIQHGGFVNTLDLALDGSDNIYNIGSFLGSLSAGNTDLTSSTMDIYVTKWDAGGKFLWAKSIGGSSADRGYCIALDSWGAIYAAGDFQQTANFSPGTDTFNLTSRGKEDIFIFKWSQPTCNTVSNIDITECDSFTFQDQTYATTGTYTYTMANTAECDSIITINLTINSTPDNAVTRSGNTFTAVAAGIQWQWINCDDNLPIAGADQQSFIATANGFYAVILTGAGGCTDTSECFKVDDIVSIKERYTDNNNIKLYPNPSRTKVTIHSDIILNNATINITNVLGQRIDQKANLKGNIFTLDINRLAAGVYIIELIEGDLSSRTKMVKE